MKEERERGREGETEKGSRGGKERSSEVEDGGREGGRKGRRLAKDTAWPIEERGSGQEKCRAGERDRVVSERLMPCQPAICCFVNCTFTHICQTRQQAVLHLHPIYSPNFHIELWSSAFFFYPFIKHMTAFIP